MTFTENPVLSLLEKISSRQINDLIFEQRLMQKGYSFYYALDNHDIHKYCFPGNLSGIEFERNSDGKINYELESDKITAYEEFFSKIGKGNNCFFLDEYISEFIGLRDEIIRIIQSSKLLNYADSFQTFLSEYNGSPSGVRADFTLYISIATGLLRNGAQRFNGLLNNPYFLVKPDDLDNTDIPHAEIVKQAFKDSLDQDFQLVDKIYQAFAQRSVKATRLSKRIDSEAIARMTRINKYLIRKFKEEKVLFLFLSSTESSRDIFYHLERELPRVEDEPFNFHRTVEQLFISRLICDLAPEDRLTRLETAKELITYREKTQQIDVRENEYMLLEERALASFHKLREKYVNVNLARMEQFATTEKLQMRLEERYSNGERDTGMRTSNLKKLYNALKEVRNKYGTDEANMDFILKLESAFRISEIFSLVFKKAIFELLQHDEPIRISRGRDPIKGTGQHLPIVFRCNMQPHGKNFDEIAELYLDQFAFVDKSFVSQKGHIITRLRDLTATIYDNNFDARSLGEKLVFCLYLLILPDARIIRDKTNNDHVAEFLGDLKRELTPDDKLLYSDFLYTSTWVMRRNKQYGEALKLAEEGIERFPEDARFYHARFLVNACREPGNYPLHLYDIEMAQARYALLLEDKSELIRRNIVAALLNSEIFAKTLIIADGKESRIEKRHALQELRKGKLERLKEMTGNTYEDYPEFLHTEAFLELHESEQEDDLDQKKRKLDWAIGTIKKGIKKAGTLIGFDLGVFNGLCKELVERKEALTARDPGRS